ncbi:hypothetical protein [Thioclava indica]|uniref:Uncharacterized protein n=1 Tax=Thioclava indica TaxID=1353528 RepID=A0A074JS68_9RHOB|nr:hypothetical protein [Thioclava indica]KEO59319.1 hypothetical protein DT23_04370 [Thioclava indica]
MSLASTNFTDRLSRIESSQKRLKGGVVLHVGDAELKVRSISELRRVVPQKQKSTGFRPFAFLGATVLGVFGVVAALALREHFMTPQIADLIKDYPNLAVSGTALLIAMIVGFFLRLTSTKLITFQIIGIFLALATLHNLAFWQPEIAAQVFSPNWVNEQSATHVARTVIIGQTTIPF